MSDWPSSNDYTIAVQNPELCFRDAELRAGTIECSRLTRMPKVWTGNFAQVYEVRTPSGRWAVKCFTRSSPDIRARYTQVARALAKARLPHFVDFQFLDDEMLVNGRRYPIVKMQWVEGQSLNEYVDGNLYNPRALLHAAETIRHIVKDLERCGLVHGDLQHGNIVVTPSVIKLVDYDGMFVGALASLGASETGLPSYQHPGRTQADYGVGLDRFSLLVICTGLCAVAADPSLWDRFNTGENILFTAADLRNPAASPLLGRLAAMRHPYLDGLVDALLAACRQKPLSVSFPALRSRADAAPAYTAWWVGAPHESRAPRPAAGGAPFTGNRPRRLSWRLPSFHLPPFRLRSWRLPSLGFPSFGLGSWRPSWPQGVRPRLSSWRRHAAAAAVSGIALAIIAASVHIGGVAGTLIPWLTALGFLVQRLAGYRRLPGRETRRALLSRVQQCRRRVVDETKTMSAAECRLADLTQEEREEERRELKRIQDRHAEILLSTIHIFRLMEMPSVGPFLVEKLWHAGVRHALDLHRRGGIVEGASERQSVEIQQKLAEWQRYSQLGAPRLLPPGISNRVARKYEGRRAAARSELALLRRRLTDVRSELTDAEAALKRLAVPSFWQFVCRA